jgi:methylated-DNA-[protein]-cysteine S-methyltransferase
VAAPVLLLARHSVGDARPPGAPGYKDATMQGFLSTPVGQVMVETVEEGVIRCGTHHVGTGRRRAVDSPVARRHLESTLQALGEYFAGTRRDFGDLALAPEGTTFQQAVWAELRRIPYGTTTSYGELARRLGRPTASRAVGAANGQNPIGIIQPCHRVIGADGNLTGFAGGLAMKAWLLRHEGASLV